MFPADNFDAQSKYWVRGIQTVIEDLENKQPALDKQLDMLQRENGSVLADVASNVNAYYTSTMAQYPVFQRTVLMETVLGGPSKTVGISAPAAADSTVAETWVSLFTHDITIPSAKTTVGVRLNGAQFRLQGPTGYRLRFRWRVSTQIEGINTSRWLSRHSFNLNTYTMDPTNPPLVNIANRYAHWSGTSTNTVTLELQACIENSSNRSLAVASQNVTLLAQDTNGNDTYLDVMVTV